MPDSHLLKINQNKRTNIEKQTEHNEANCIKAGNWGKNLFYNKGCNIILITKCVQLVNIKTLGQSTHRWAHKSSWESRRNLSLWRQYRRASHNGSKSSFASVSIIEVLLWNEQHSFVININTDWSLTKADKLYNINNTQLSWIEKSSWWLQIYCRYTAERSSLFRRRE